MLLLDPLRHFGLEEHRGSSPERRGWTSSLQPSAWIVDTTHLAKIEAGSINLTVATLVRVAHGLGVELSELFAR